MAKAALSDRTFLLALALVKLLLHFLTNGRYGFFRDELYYVACGERLAWGYVDQPPLIAVMAKVSRLLGDLLFALRFFPAVAGAIQVFLAGWTARQLGAKRFGQSVAALAVLAAPYYPVLSIETFLRYDSFLRFGTAVQAERDRLTRLPQLYADMLGWEELVAKVAGVYQGLSPEERSRCAILADDYGEAGAIDLLGGRHHLPKAISGHNNYYLWGPRRYSGEVVLSIGYPSDVLKSVFEQVQAAGTVPRPDGIQLSLYLCRKPKESLQAAWPKFRIFM